MGKKLALLLTLVITVSLFSFGGHQVKNAAAAPSFEKVSQADGVVTAQVLNMRQGPDTKYPVISTLKKGQKLKIIGKLGKWYAIYDISGGFVGAVHSDYIKLNKAGTTAASTKPVPPSPSKPQQTPQQTKDTQASKETSGEAEDKIDISADEKKLLELINKERAKAGVKKLEPDAELMKVAGLKAEDMVEHAYFDHGSPTYGSPFEMMKQFGLSFKSAGENIAGNESVDAVFRAWLEDTGLKNNMLNKKFSLTGIGIEESKAYGKIVVQMFIGK